MKAAHPGATPAHQRRAWSATRVLARVDVEPISAAQSSSNQFQKSTAESDGTKVLATPTPTVLPTATPKTQLMPTPPSKRAAESTTLDVPPQAKHLRGEGPQMEVQSMTVAGVTTAGTEDEDPRRVLRWPRQRRRIDRPCCRWSRRRDDEGQAERELHRFVEFGVYKTAGYPCCSGRETSRGTLEGPQNGRNQGATCRERVQGR